MNVPDDDVLNTLVSAAPTSNAGSDAAVTGHYLVVLEGAEPGRVLEVGAVPLTIGRDPRQMLVFPDTQLSRLHARVSLVAGDLVVEDLGSTNGTFVDGARITAPTILREGSALRLGRQLLRHERRSRRDVERARELDRDLHKARSYVLSLLPAPIDVGPLRAEWRYVPSAPLGGDAFGYHWLDRDAFVFYLMDVSGHGVGAAMHSVTVLNLLRQRALPQVDFGNPAEVLSSLNTRFQMDSHNWMYFTIWYGVYRPSTRTLAYGTAGHHPAYLVSAAREHLRALGTPHLMIGASPDSHYDVEYVDVPPGSALYLFSDGVFEIVARDGQQLGLDDFLPYLRQAPLHGVAEPERLYGLATERARPGFPEDDVSILTVRFS